MSRKYLLYRFKSSKVALVFFLAVYLTLTMAPFIIYTDDLTNSLNFVELSLVIGLALSMAMTFILPVMTLSYAHLRHKCDQYFALPVKRSQMLVSEIIFMEIIAGGYFLIAACAVYLLYGMNQVILPALLGLCMYVVLITLELLIIHSALYLFANNKFDGLVTIAAWTLMPMLTLVVLQFGLGLLEAGGGSSSLASTVADAISPLATNYMAALRLIEYAVGYKMAEPVFKAYQIVIPLILTVIGAVLLRYHFVERKIERAEQLSDDLLSYRSIISLYTASIIFVFACVYARHESVNIFYWLLLFFVFVIATFVYQRKIVLNLPIVVKFTLAALAAFIIAEISWNTRCFGMADSFDPLSYEYVRVYYYTRVDAAALGDLYNGSQANVSVNISPEINTADDQYGEVLSILENNRKANIDAFYENHGNDDEVTGYISLRVSDNEDWYTYDDRRVYSVYVSLTADELKTIGQYFDVQITD